MQKKYLMTPGPTPVPAEIMLTMAKPIIHHRTPDFSAAFAESIAGLKYVFQTEGDVLLFACSGTGVMESAIANCFSAGDTVIVCRNGKFGDRQKLIAETYGLTVVDLAVRVDRGRQAGRRREGPRRAPGGARRHRHAVRDQLAACSTTSRRSARSSARSKMSCSSSTPSPASAPWSAGPTSGASTWS